VQLALGSWWAAGRAPARVVTHDEPMHLLSLQLPALRRGDHVGPAGGDDSRDRVRIRGQVPALSQVRRPLPAHAVGAAFGCENCTLEF